MSEMAYIFWGVVYAAMPAALFGLLFGLIFQDIQVGVLCFIGGFIFGLDILFGKGAECRQSER